jgi:hypothetical protein
MNGMKGENGTGGEGGGGAHMEDSRGEEEDEEGDGGMNQNVCHMEPKGRPAVDRKVESVEEKREKSITPSCTNILGCHAIWSATRRSALKDKQS